MTANTLLLRQVHPSFVQEGRISSQVFRPTPKDEFQLSSYHGDMITPALAYQHYTQSLGLSSVGVVAVNKGECDSVSLPVIDDGVPFREHITLDFRSLTKPQMEKIAKILRTLAANRSWLFGPS